MQALAVGCTGGSGGAIGRMSAATAVVFNVDQSIVEREREQHLCVVLQRQPRPRKQRRRTVVDHAHDPTVVPTTGVEDARCLHVLTRAGNKVAAKSQIPAIAVPVPA